MRALSRERAKDATLDYGSAAERRELASRSAGQPSRPTAEQAQEKAAATSAARRGLHPLTPESGIVVEQPEALPTCNGPERAEEHPRPLLPVHGDPEGRDSLGRGTTAPEIAAAVGQDPAVLR
ncbi:putative Zn-finger protein [Roseomonas pecuniae]|uniref:Putative Zn-finger protein n=1 Tax=Muricoccus pecuniae TaxID=693023 RepID=A0A840YHM0_9PROT|nr:putative Zn-finger protein [Roseomonas pecuniae]